MNAIEHDFETFGKWRPSQFDVAGVGVTTETSDWLVMPWFTNRDADCLTRANWQAAGNALPEGENVQYHHFGHWGPGWIEIMIIRPGSPELEKAAEMAAALADYPVLDDALFGELEAQERAQDWENGEWRNWLNAAISDETPAFHAACLEVLTAETAWGIFEALGGEYEDGCFRFRCHELAYDDRENVTEFNGADEADKEFALLMADIARCKKQRDIGLADYPRFDWRNGYAMALETIAGKMVDLGFNRHFVRAIIEAQ